LLFRWSERVFAIVLLLAMMGVIDVLTRPQSDGHDLSTISSDVPQATGIAITGVYFWGAMIVVARWRRVLRVARTAWPLLAFAALAPISAAWSIDPALTLRKSVLVMASTMLAIYLGERYRLQQLAHLLAGAMSLMMLMVLALRFTAPSHVIDEEGAWRGLSPHKNAFGANMGIAVVVLLLMRFNRFNLLRYFLAATAAVLLVLSHSMTALAGSVLVLAAVPLWQSMRSNSERQVLACAIAGIVLFLVIFLVNRNPDLFFQLVGRDPSFTGRTKLWSLVLPAIAKHPLLGYGYGAFWWTGLSGEALSIWIRSRWLPTAADNGYLDLLLDFGVLALPLLSYLLFQAVRMAVRHIRTERQAFALWPAAYFSFFLLDNIFESQLLPTRSLEFLLFAAITTSLAVHRCSDPVLSGHFWTGHSPAGPGPVQRASNANA